MATNPSFPQRLMGQSSTAVTLRGRRVAALVSVTAHVSGHKLKFKFY